jgi:hypothetical protein
MLIVVAVWSGATQTLILYLHCNMQGSDLQFNEIKVTGSNAIQGMVCLFFLYFHILLEIREILLRLFNNALMTAEVTWCQRFHLTRRNINR